MMVLSKEFRLTIKYIQAIYRTHPPITVPIPAIWHDIV